MNSKEGLKVVIGNIKRIRQARGLTKKQVAEKVRLDYSNYCRLENHKIHNPRFATLILIAESLEVNWEEIFENCH